VRSFRVNVRVSEGLNSYQIFLDSKLPNKFLYKLPPRDRRRFRHGVCNISVTFIGHTHLIVSNPLSGPYKKISLDSLYIKSCARVHASGAAITWGVATLCFRSHKHTVSNSLQKVQPEILVHLLINRVFAHKKIDIFSLVAISSACAQNLLNSLLFNPACRTVKHPCKSGFLPCVL
jgi:hypothetical protein